MPNKDCIFRKRWIVMNTKRLCMRNYVLPALLLLCVTLAGFAQTESGRFQGTVTDAAGAVVSGASVTVRSTATGREAKAVTNGDGNYVVLSLSPGRYHIEVTQTNFKTVKQDITLEVAQDATLDFALQAGAVSETVTVTNDVP